MIDINIASVLSYYVWCEIGILIFFRLCDLDLM